jgi:uncharacterized membrane protein
MKPSWRTELPQWIIIAAMFGVAAWSWPRLPDRIPIHWNIAGEIDGYGGKFTGLLLLPLTVLGLYLMMRLIYLIDPGRENYASFATAFTVIRMTFVFFMAAIYLGAVLATFGHRIDMTTIICFAMAVLFGILGNFMGKLRPNWFIGVRTPWTLSSKMSWNKTHRLAGWLFLFMALFMLAAGLIRTNWMLITMLAVDALCIAWMIVYSYLVYRRDPDRIPPAGVSPG